MMNTITEATVITHKWQELGVGVAPFRVKCVLCLPSPTLAEHNPTAYNNAMQDACGAAKSLGVHLGTCDVCGMGILNNYVIQGADGGRFVVGCDCAVKTADHKLITQIEAEQRKLDKAKRKAKAEQEWKRKCDLRESAEAAQRVANGGLTDYELAEANDQAERAAKAMAMAEQNAWLVDVLSRVDTNGSFLPSIIRDLAQVHFTTLSDRALNILSEIWAKAQTGKSRGNVYDEGVNQFWSHFPEDF